MFSTVARPARAPRRAGPFVLSLLLNGGTIAALVALGAREVERVVEAEVAMERPYELRVPELPGGDPAPGPKAPRAARSTPAKAAPAPVDVEPADIAPLAEPASASLPEAPAADGGGGDGVADLGGGGGSGGGGGGGGGDGDGGGGGGPRTVHWTEVQVRTRAVVRPSDYPPAASALNLPDTRCVVRIVIDEAGRPTEVVPKTCPEVFRAAAEGVALRYRFWPLRDAEGRPVRAAFDLALNFRGGG